MADSSEADLVGTIDVESIIGGASQERSRVSERRVRAGLTVSLIITIVWVIYVSIAGHWGRVADHWASALTMVFGSFVAGSTPQGGGAVAFPVFTKILEIPAEVARSFSLLIQSIGMTTASISILVNRRAIDRRAIAIAAPASCIGFLLGYLLITDNDSPYSPSLMPGAYVKVTFTVVVAAMAAITYLGYRSQLVARKDSLGIVNGRVVWLIAILSLTGGVASLLVGSGSDVFVYLALVLVIGMSPRVGVATSVIVMTIVSLLGLIVFGVIEGHLSVLLEAGGAKVESLNGRELVASSGGAAYGAGTGPVASRFDLFGLWLAAVPVVAWGAPLGSAVSSRATDRQLVRFVVLLAAAEAISTVIFLEPLRTDTALVVYALALTVAMFSVLWLLRTNRDRILGIRSVDPNQSITRTSVDVGPRLSEQLDEQD